jgi:hypothetical protein
MGESPSPVVMIARRAFGRGTQSQGCGFGDDIHHGLKCVSAITGPSGISYDLYAKNVLNGYWQCGPIDAGEPAEVDRGAINQDLHSSWLAPGAAVVTDPVVIARRLTDGHSRDESEEFGYFTDTQCLNHL